MASSLMSPLLWQEVPHQDRTAWYDYLRLHADSHWHLARATATRFILLDDLRDQAWFDLPERQRRAYRGRDNLLPHQLLHDGVAKALGLPLVGDLVSANLADENDFVSWMQLHALDHFRFQNVAGL